MNDLISVIVPVFRVEKYLKKCISSIQAQTYRNLEIILVDDGSDDGSSKICDDLAKNDSRIKVIHKSNGGLSSARNAGIELANGDYIGFVDSDDYIVENMYETLYSLMNQNNADIAICDFFQWDQNGVIGFKCKKEIQIYEKEEIIKRFFRINQDKGYFSVWCRLYKASILKNIRFTENVVNEDVDYSYRVFMNCKNVVETSEKLYAYNVGNVSITRNSLTPKDLDLYKVWDNIYSYAQKYDIENLKAIEYNIKRIDFTLVVKFAMFGITGFDDPNKIIMEMVLRLRKNYRCILHECSLDIKRKIAVVLCAFNPFLVRKLFKYKIIKHQL